MQSGALVGQPAGFQVICQQSKGVDERLGALVCLCCALKRQPFRDIAKIIRQAIPDADCRSHQLAAAAGAGARLGQLILQPSNVILVCPAGAGLFFQQRLGFSLAKHQRAQHVVGINLRRGAGFRQSLDAVPCLVSRHAVDACVGGQASDRLLFQLSRHGVAGGQLCF